MSKKIQVLLLKPLPPKGNAGDVIEVKAHYAEYVLIPEGVAVVYDKQTQNQRDAQMKKIAKNKSDLLASVQHMVEKVTESGGITFTKAVTETGGLYDSITTKSLTHWAEENFHVRLASTSFHMEKIEEIGEYTAEFTYEDVTGSFPIHVVAEAA
jgi:ribosomal protein L9